MKLHTEAVAILPLEAFMDHRLSLIQLRVLGAIFSWRNRDTSVASVYRDQLAKRSGYSEAQVSRATTALVALGWLRKEGVGGRGIATRYQVIVPDLECTETVTDSGTDSTPQTVPDSGTVTDPVTVTSTDTVHPLKRCPDRTENGDRSGHTLQSNHRKADQKQKQPPAKNPPAAREPMPEIPEWIDREAWAGFEQMRRKQRFPLTAHAAALVIRKLDELREHGHDPTAVLDQSTRNAWRDVYPIKRDQQTDGKSKPSLVERAEADLRGFLARNGA